LIVFFPIIKKNGNEKYLHWPKIDNFATFLGEKRKKFVTALLDAFKVEKSVNIENYPPKLQYRSAILSIHNSTRTITQLYADEYATVSGKSAYSLRNCTRFWWKRGTKVCLYRTRPRLGGVREGMVETKQTKVVYHTLVRFPSY